MKQSLSHCHAECWKWKQNLNRVSQVVLLPFSSNSLCAMIAYRIEEREATLIN